MNPIRFLFFGAALAAMVLALAGRQDGQRPDDDAAAADQTVAAGLMEFVIEMPGSLPAGTIAFEVTNNGTMEHNFEVEGMGIEEEFEENLQPGETETLTVTLEPGTYEVYCPIPGHADQGMMLELTVTE